MAASESSGGYAVALSNSRDDRMPLQNQFRRLQFPRLLPVS
jgi:hypothetical protein